MKKDAFPTLAPRVFRWSLVTLIAVLAAQVAAAALGLEPWVNWDVAMNLVTGRKLLEGARLYVDWIDNNPPAVYWLAAGVARLAASPVAQVTIYHSFVLALGLVGLLSLRALRRDADDERLAVSYAAVATMTLGATIEALHFAQRDHLVAIAFVAFGALRLLGAHGRVALVWAFFLGLASAQKPHLLLVVVAFEGALAGARPSRTLLPIAACLAIGVALPFLAFLALHPTDGGLMIERAFRYHVSPAGRAFRVHDLASILSNASTAATAIAAAASIALLVAAYAGDRLPARQAATALALIAAGVFATLAPAKYYPYHFFTLAAALLVTGLYALAHVDAARGRSLAFALLLSLGALSGKSALLLVNHALAGERLDPTGIARELEGKARVALVTTSAFDLLSVFYLPGVELVGPLPYHLDFPQLTHLHGERLEEALAAYAAGPMRAVLAQDPDVVLFSPSNYALAGHAPSSYPAMLRLLAPYLDLRAYEPRVFEGYGSWVAYERKRAP